MRPLLASLLLSTSLVLLANTPSVAAETPLWKGAKWIWDKAGAQTNDSRYLRRRFQLADKPTAAKIHITVDNAYTLFVNGKKVGGDDDWSDVEEYDITKLLTKGTNVLAIDARNAGGKAAAICWMKITASDKSETIIGTDDTWLVSLAKTESWQEPDFDEANWSKAVAIGSPDASPWNITGKKPSPAAAAP